MPTKRPIRADRLAAYRAKRSAESTPEPFWGDEPERPRLFVVQKHAARRLHYDLRLEIGGALHSWAVPRGPSLDPADKRLAVEVEDHPLDYADFEGIIPEGNYGAGAVIVWDRGQWQPVGDPDEGLGKGKLLFDLRGYKLRGGFTLVRTKGKPNEWLLVKKPDAFAAPGATLPEESVLSGLTVEALREGSDPASAIRARLEQLQAPRGAVKQGSLDLGLMLAETSDRAFSRPGWLFELKYDGYRVLGIREGERAIVRYRRGLDATASFPEIGQALRSLPYDSLVLDGELVVLDETGKATFQRLQQRVQLTRRPDIARATVDLPATMIVFDLLCFEDYDLRALPLRERKEILRLLLPKAGALRYSDHVEERGEALFDEVTKRGLEGIMAKSGDSPYVAGRSSAWLKIRADRTGDFAVVGFSPPRGSRAGFGALHLGALRDGELVYAGRVGSGFDTKLLERLRADLEQARRRDPPCSGPLPADKGHTWVEPRLVCEVRFKEWTDEGLLRQPVFLRLREDKTVEDCLQLDGGKVQREPPPPAVREPPPPPAPRTIPFTNLVKAFWPKEGYTKGDLIEYHRSMAPWLLPYLEDRPVVLTRYPDGIEGKSFFQKDAPSFAPDWVRTEKLWSEDAQREIRYFVCNDEESLLYLINLGTIPLHLWSSRATSLGHPDWCILDLDPKRAPFAHVIRVARSIHALCEEIGLASFVKTSGSTGLHVLLPLGRQCTYEQSRTLGQVLARIIAAELPTIATITRAPGARGERVYIDYVQNGHGRLLVAPWSVRPLPGAPVSTPLRWTEVKPGLDIRTFTITTVPARMRRAKTDPMRPLLEIRPDLEEVLAHLAERLERSGGRQAGAKTKPAE